MLINKWCWEKMNFHIQKTVSRSHYICIFDKYGYLSIYLYIAI
jgi:hypothetical protein